MYSAVLSKVGDVQLAVTTHLNINFRRCPAPGDIVGHASLLKLGRKLAVGEVSIYGGNHDQLVDARNLHLFARVRGGVPDERHHV